MKKLPPEQHKIFKTLNKHLNLAKKYHLAFTVRLFAESMERNYNSVQSTLIALKRKGLIGHEPKEYSGYIITDDGKKYLSIY